MITITARSFWDAECKLAKRKYKNKTKLTRNHVEGQLRKMLANVKDGSLKRRDVVAITTVEGMIFPKDYEKSLSRRGFAVIPVKYNATENTSVFHIILKNFEKDYAPLESDTNQ